MIARTAFYKHVTLLLLMPALAFVVCVKANADGFPKFSGVPNINGDKASGASHFPLQLCGQATLKAYKLFTVGESALYRPDCKAQWQLRAKEPKLMYFRYARAIPGNAFAESAIAMLNRNLQLTENQQRTLAQFHKLYRDVEEGDTYAMSYTQQYGLQLFLNNILLGDLQEQPLAHQYFSIWLGNKPFDETLKEDLLGR